MCDIAPILTQIVTLGRTLGAQKIVLFGSRARGDNHERSDIDLAVYGLPATNVGQFLFELEELPTLLKFDVVQVDEDTDVALVTEIETDGVTVYETNENFQKAVLHLAEGVAEYHAHPSTTARDGVIQRFEFTFELAWKS